LEYWIQGGKERPNVAVRNTGEKAWHRVWGYILGNLKEDLRDCAVAVVELINELFHSWFPTAS
jgi:hypothetical protein